MTYVVPDINAKFSTGNIVYEVAEKTSNLLTLPRFIPKVGLSEAEAENTDAFIEVEQAKMSTKEAREKGELGDLKKMRENSEYPPLGVREYTSEKLNVEWMGGYIPLSKNYFERVINNPSRLANDVAPMFGVALNKFVLDSFNELVSVGGHSSYTQDADETYSNYLISAKSAYNENAGSIEGPELMLASNKSIEGISKEIQKLNEQITPSADIRKYYGVDGIQYSLQNTTTYNGGELLEGKKTYGFRRDAPPLEMVYLKDPEFSTIPITENMEETEFNFTPLIGYDQQFLEKPRPKKYHLYFECRVGIIKNNPENLFVGEVKYDQ